MFTTRITASITSKLNRSYILTNEMNNIKLSCNIKEKDLFKMFMNICFEKFTNHVPTIEQTHPKYRTTWL